MTTTDPAPAHGTSPGRVRSAEELQELARQGAEQLAGASAQEIIAWARDVFGERVGVASSMQDTVLLHLVADVHPGTDVLFLETGYHFAETLATRDRVAAEYPLTVRSLTAAQSVAEQDAAYGRDLFASNPDLCCMLRKTTPLFEALEGYEAWMTGLRRAESQTRASAPVVTFDAEHGLVKINPIVAWTDEQVDAYVAAQESTDRPVISNPLLTQGYPSIGCAPCTSKVAEGEDPRSGRWAGRDKTECGIHTDHSGPDDATVIRTDGTGIGRTPAETVPNGYGLGGERSPRPESGGTIWLTGLSGAGKTTVSEAVQRKLAGRAGADGTPLRVELLDGDELRAHLSPTLGFSREDRDAHVTRVGYLARLLARNGVLVLVPVIAPYRQARDAVRTEHEADGSAYALVYVSTSVETCAQRDVKGLYAKQAAGEIAHLTGVDDPYEAPTNADLDLDTTDIDIDAAADRVIALAAERGML